METTARGPVSDYKCRLQKTHQGPKWLVLLLECWSSVNWKYCVEVVTSRGHTKVTSYIWYPINLVLKFSNISHLSWLSGFKISFYFGVLKGFYPCTAAFPDIRGHAVGQGWCQLRLFYLSFNVTLFLSIKIQLNSPSLKTLLLLSAWLSQVNF